MTSYFLLLSKIALIITTPSSLLLCSSVDGFSIQSQTKVSRVTPPSSATSSRHYLFDDDNNNNYDDDLSSSSSSSSSFSMASLNARLQEVKEKESILPLVVFDAMVPRQSLTLTVNNAKLLNLIRDCVFERENPTVGMVGIARLRTGDYIHLKKGVEVEIVLDKESAVQKGSSSLATVDGRKGKTNSSSKDDNDDNDTDDESSPNKKEGITVTFKATGRRFEIDQVEEKVGSTRTSTYCIEQVDGGWTEAKVKYYNSAQEEQNEINGDTDSNSANAAGSGVTSNEQAFYDRAAVARAILKSNECTSPNMNMPNNVSLIDRWIELATLRERSPGQIDRLLQQLGEIPPSEEPTERAFWIGALINPIPAMGVAMEIRPALLTATKVEERVGIALQGLTQSIQHMSK